MRSARKCVYFTYVMHTNALILGEIMQRDNLVNQFKSINHSFALPVPYAGSCRSWDR